MSILRQRLHLFLFLLLKIKFLLQISLFYLLAVLPVHIVNFLNLNYQMLLVIQILLFSILIVKIVKNLKISKLYVKDMVLLPFQPYLFQKMELLRLFATLLFLRMTF